jgi:peroxiredoxin
VDTAISISYGMLWVIVVVQGLVMIECLRQIGILRLRLGDEPGALIPPEALDRGTPAPAFSLVDSRTLRRVTEESLRGRRSLALFMSPSCSPCRALAADMPRFADYYPEVNLVAFCSGPEAACAAFAKEFQFPFPLLIDSLQSVSQAYGASRTPHAVLFDEEARVLIQGVPADWKQLEHLLDEEGTVMGVRNWLLMAEPGETLPSDAAKR